MKRKLLLVPALLIGLGAPLLNVVPAHAAPPTDPVVIQSQTGTNKVVDIRHSSTASGAVVQTWSENGSAAQSFKWSNCDEAGTCEIRNIKSLKCLDVRHSGTAKGTPVQQYTCNGTKAQRWLPVSVAKGLVNIKSAVAPNRWLNVRGGVARNGTRLEIWSHNDTKAQLFRLTEAPNWGISYAQVGETTAVKASIADLDSIAGVWATRVTVTARMNYGAATTRTVTFTQDLSKLAEPEFTWDVGDYGKWNITATFYKGSTRVRSNSRVKLGVTASEYIIAPLTGTMPVTMLTTSLWGEGSIRGTANHIPVIAQFSRARQWDWSKLPKGVHAVPYLTKAQAASPVTGTYLNDHLAPMAAYIKDLRALNGDSIFHLYVNDFHVQMVHSLLYATRTPAANYTVTILSDGTFSYSKFAEAYSTDPDAAHATYIRRWNDAKAYAYEHGQRSRDLTVSAAQRLIYAAVEAEPSTRWWLTRPSLLASPGDNNAFAAKAVANPLVMQLNIANRLTSIKAAGAPALSEFKSLYRFNDAYFAHSTASGNKVMMFLGTKLATATAPGESQFPEYARFTMKYYGADYDYYYKGHPASPTATSPAKKAQLQELGIRDIDSSVPAELILFFNPDIYLSGYPSTTYMSVSEPDMAKGLFTLTKQAALAAPTANYSIMSWFMAPKPDSGPVAALHGDFVVEFADWVADKEGYHIAMWNSTTRSITYFALVDGSYKPVLR